MLTMTQQHIMTLSMAAVEEILTAFAARQESVPSDRLYGELAVAAGQSESAIRAAYEHITKERAADHDANGRLRATYPNDDGLQF
jgi:hypothetical protein